MKEDLTNIIQALVSESIHDAHGETSQSEMEADVFASIQKQKVKIDVFVKKFINNTYNKHLKSRASLPTAGDSYTVDMFYSLAQWEQCIIKSGDKFCKVGDANIAWLQKRREAQIAHMRQASASFDREEALREQVIPILESNPEYVVADAIAILNPKKATA